MFVSSEGFDHADSVRLLSASGLFGNLGCATDKLEVVDNDEIVLARSVMQPRDFALLFERHHARLHGFLARRLGPDAADDLTSEIFVRAFRRRDTFDVEKGSVIAWFYGFAHRVMAEHRRSEVRQLRQMEAAEWAHGAELVVDDFSRIDDATEAVDQCARVMQCLAELRPQERDVFVGTGVQARRQIEAHLALLGRELDVRVWGRSPDAAQRVIEDVQRCIEAVVVSDLAEACGDADIIVTTTAATAPLIAANWIQPGSHITAVGADAPGKHELEPELLRRADIVVADSWVQCVDHGELSAIANDSGLENRAVEIGDILAGRPGRNHVDDLTIADLTGTAAQDIAAARYVLNALG